MPKLTRWGRSSLLTAILAGAIGGSVVGCGDNKPAGRPMTDGGAGANGDGGGNDAPATACTGSFISPTAGAMLTVADAIGGTCTGGFKINVRVATSQPDGTSVDLLVGAAKVATATVSGAEVHFDNVQLPEGSNILKASFSATCSLMNTVTVSCNLPTCTITKPVISATHVSLNGVPVANGGDRASATGQPYQVEFDVMTNVEDGQSVSLNITNPTVGTGTTVVAGSAVGGRVVFPGVALIPDGNYMVEALCTNRAGAVGRSTKGTYPVDSTPPALTISSPVNGKYFPPGELTNNAFAVCAQTADKDATSDTAKNLSVAVGNGSPDPNTGSVALTAQNTDGCVNVTCASSAPFNLTVTLRDAAGNSTVKSVTNITCATTLPSVEIVSPAGDSAPFSDPTKHLLAATSTQAFKDQSVATAGAQWPVVACTDTAGMVTLFGGVMGGNLTVLAGPVATVAAVAGDNCRSGFSQAAHFTAVTLPESQEDTDGSLLSATELRADIATSASATNQSTLVDIWVDSSAPNIAPSIPADLCGKVYQSTTDQVTSVRLLSTTPTVSMTVTGSTTMTYAPNWAGGFATFTGVTFPLGTDQVTATGTDKAGNSSALVSPCTVTVGTPPIVTFVTPQPTNTLCAAGQTSGTCIPDSNGTTAGWQGDLDATVTVTGVPTPVGMVTFSLGTTDLGTVAIDGTGHARLTGVTIPDGKSVVLTAATSDISGHGIGMTSETLIVDTVIPDRVLAITPTVKDRRQTSFHLAWIAPADGGQALFSYIVKVSKSAITAANFDAATTITYTGTPAAPTTADGIDATGLLIENNYYFAVASVDAAGNRGTIATAGPSIAHFNMNILVPPTGGGNERFGYSIDGVADVNGDGRSDILVGTQAGQRVYVFDGAAGFNTVTAPTTVITGQANVSFGRQFVDIGDIDADGKEDFAISAAQLGNGKIYIFKGRAAWNASYSADSDADYVLDFGATYTATQLGNTISRLGDFNGDGVDDFAVGAFNYNGGRGRVVIVLGKSGFSAASPTLQVIDGDPAYPAGNFGGSVLGMGRFYSATSGTSLAVNAPSAGANTRGRVYAFHGIPGTAATVVATAADNFVEGPVASGFYGTTLGLIGSIGAGPGLAISTGSVTALGVGIVDLHFGSSIAGPFVSSPLRFTDSLSVTAVDLFGRMVAGNAFPGTSITTSVIGDGKPDVILAPNGESSGGPARLYIIDGARLFAITSPADVVTAADVIVPLPIDWKVLPLTRNGSIRDVDGDGYADFAVGEGVANTVGRVAVFW